MVDATPGLLTSLTQVHTPTLAEQVKEYLLTTKMQLLDYKVTDLPVMAFFAEPNDYDTGGNIDITFANLA